MNTTRGRLDTVRKLTMIAAFTASAAAATEIHFGPTALAATETARLNAYCDGSVEPTPCTITFEFRMADGSVRLADTLTLQPGTSGFVDLPAAKAGIMRGRGEIDPCWDIARGAALASLEIYDSGSQRTRLLINWGDRSLPRTGDIDFSPFAITPSDTARLGAFCPEDQRASCNVTFEFHDANGRTLKQTTATIPPGGSAFSDFQATGRRVTLQPCFKVGDSAVVGTVAIIDNGLGLPAVQAYPALLVR
jgi:hypothetical protein